ncbi:MAG TPA: bifunctional 2-C-methyl-D-erythritol 4-phosphate cytidylyltransferase/2-C-methyl-D-erythritol 2,4-cyclodiphosphate synthase [Alphaproteobacteria bacterium]|nr:bifunctional 2-C-methyl-D-erythritol 4-phosphate cytidylyltransferase/2-C-methyl-D-erythritol 2,4-cyclodiphosphate synthase [Alphaproteobacteria bacterium]
MVGCIALVVAGGRGARFGGELPKQYRRLGPHAILRHSVEAFRRHPRIDRVRVVIHPDDRSHYDEAVAGLDLLDPCLGGKERQDSARLGLESLAALKPLNVLIHDAARPLVDADTIGRVISALDDAQGAIAAVPVTDTLKRGEDGRIVGTVERAGLWRAQTPQGFRYDAILAAHRALAGEALTDDAAVAERAGLAVRLIPASEENFKVTTEEDLRRGERFFGTPFEQRVGIGFDVHHFGPGDHVMICGLRVPHTHGTVGHSDADVGLHALTDALLGTIGSGDIGSHFPPSDPRWKGEASRHFLRHAADLAQAQGASIVNVDVTIICESPKVGPHRQAMRQSIAEILSIDVARVSVKATTTDKLGFAGRGEGMAAQAIATVRVPALLASRTP